jgi:hypothetical protein
VHQHERSLVMRYQNRPFVVLGVNGDSSRDLMRRSEREEQLTFRSWWDGPFGPIATRWSVEGFPTLFLIDQRGQIRWDSPGRPKSFEPLDRKIEQLVREAEQTSAL